MKNYCFKQIVNVCNVSYERPSVIDNTLWLRGIVINDEPQLEQLSGVKMCLLTGY